MKSLKKIKSYFLVRMDDIHPRMNHDNFNRMINILSNYSIQGILGVIPDNKDKCLYKSDLDSDFWKKIKALEQKGFWIAQHGYQHLYDTQEGGLLNLNQQSEFAGHPKEVQRHKMTVGKQLLEEKGLTPKLFMAPSHSFDANTLEVIKELGYGITDGYGLWPKIEKGILWIPQLFASPRHLRWGLYTICLHTDKMSEKSFGQLEKHLRRYNNSYIKPKEIEHYLLHKHQYGKRLINFILTQMVKSVLFLKRNNFRS